MCWIFNPQYNELRVLHKPRCRGLPEYLLWIEKEGTHFKALLLRAFSAKTPVRGLKRGKDSITHGDGCGDHVPWQTVPTPHPQMRGTQLELSPFTLGVASANTSAWCACPPWCLYCTFIAGDERPRPPLQSWRDDGAISVGKDVLWIVVDVFPTVSAGLHETHRERNKIRHMPILYTNISDCYLSMLMCMIRQRSSFLAGLESVRLCGRQMIVNERGITAHPALTITAMVCGVNISATAKHPCCLNSTLCAARGRSWQHPHINAWAPFTPNFKRAPLGFTGISAGVGTVHKV